MTPEEIQQKLKDKIAKLNEFATTLQISWEAILIPSKSALNAGLVYTDHEKYDEKTNDESSKEGSPRIDV